MKSSSTLAVLLLMATPLWVAAAPGQQPPQSAPKQEKNKPKDKASQRIPAAPQDDQAVPPAAAEAPRPIKPAADQFKTVTEKIYKHELTNKDTFVYLKVNIAIGEALIIEFPEALTLVGGEPVIGDQALLKVETVPNPLTVKVWSVIFQGATEAQMYGLNSNIQFKINSGMTFIFNFIISPPEAASNRIIFSYPEWEKGIKGTQNALAALKTKMQDEYEKKEKTLDTQVERRAFERVTEKFSEFFMCNTYSNRADYKLVFLASDRICRLGDDTILINFIVKNRYKQYFYVKQVKVYSVTSGGTVEIDNPHIHLPVTGIKFDQVLQGAVGIKSKDYTPSYVLELEEEGGLKRVIRLEVGF